MNSLSIENIKGLNVMSLDDNTAEVGIAGTDISFTLIQGYDIAKMEPGDLLHLWVNMKTEEMSLTKWIGNDATFVNDTIQFSNLIRASTNSDDFKIQMLLVKKYDTVSKTLTAELLPRGPRELYWDISMTDDNDGYFIKPVSNR